jgi:DNA-binding XRE family transcriptional regulator
MITKRETATAVPDSVTLALAVLMDRIRTLPQEDKDDLFELSKVVLTSDSQEEIDRARAGMQEILEQQSAALVPVRAAEGPGNELTNWISFVSNKIRDTRKAANMTQEQLAQKSNLPQSHISRLEKGEHSPTFATLEKLARALGVPVSDFDPCAP